MASTPGWYPDPAGDPALERYWDGVAWLPMTRPRAPQPAPRRTGLVLGLVALALALVAGVVTTVVLVTRENGSGVPGLAGPADPAGGGDPGDPDDPAPVPADPKQLPPVDLADCPTYDDSVAVADAGDGRLHGGGLSVPLPEGFAVSGNDDYPWPFPWGQDFQVADRPVAPQRWFSTIVMARLPPQPGYDGTKATAALILSCIVDSELWYPSDDWEVVRSEGREVDGHEGWLLGAEVRLDDFEVESETTYVLVVDMGPGRDDALFLASTTDTEEGRAVDDVVERAINDLEVED